MAVAEKTMPRLKATYRNEIIAKLQQEFGLTNINQVPGLTKIVVNMGVGEAARDGKLIEGAISDLTKITGQKPKVTLPRNQSRSSSFVRVSQLELR